MQKIAVGKSIARAYGFLFGRIFQIIGLAWLPALIYAGGNYYFLQHLPASMPVASHNMAALGPTIGLYAAAGLAALLIHSVLAIALTQQALGVRKDVALAHFVIGPRELRLSLAWVRLYLIFIVGYVAVIALAIAASVAAGRVMGGGASASVKTTAATGAAAQALGTHASSAAVVFHGSPLFAYAAGVVIFVLLVALILAILRLAYLIAPVAAVDHHASLMESWRLTKGSAWRIVLVILGIFLPVAIVAGCAIWFLAGDGLAKAVHDMLAVPPPNSKILMQFESANAFVFACVGGIALVVMAALQAGATAAGYRMATGHDEEESEDDDALVAPLMAPAHHDDGHGGGHDDHDDHGHGGDDDHGHGAGHDDHGQGDGHDDHGDGHDDHGHGGSHDDHANGGGHDDHGHAGHDDHGHADNHGHDDHGHGHSDHGHGDHGHGHHAAAA